MVNFEFLQGRSFASHNQSRTAMSAHIYKKLEIVGSSPTSIEEAVNNAVAKAAETIRNIRWVELVETRCHVEDQKLVYWQVTCKIGFTLDEN
jgi:dodecin